MENKKECEMCYGTSIYQDMNQTYTEECPFCNGKGYIEYETGVTDGFYKETSKEPCDCQLTNLEYVISKIDVIGSKLTSLEDLISDIRFELEELEYLRTMLEKGDAK